MILQGYYDDSGSHKSSQIFLVGGFLTDSSTWASFTDAWQAELNRDPCIDFLHTSDAYAAKGEFENWPRTLIQKKLFDLAEVIVKFDLDRVDASILQQDFAELIKGKFPGPVADDPYFLCYYTIVTALAREPNLVGLDIQFMFDEQGTAGLHAQAAWCQLLELFPKAYKRMSQPIFGNDKQYLPLQAADLYAWHARHYMIGKLKDSDNSDLMYIHRRFLGLKHLSLCITRNHLAELAEAFALL